MVVCLLDYSDLKMLAKVYDHTGAEAKRGTITAIVIQLSAKAVCVSL